MDEQKLQDQALEGVSGGAQAAYELVCTCGRRKDWTEGAVLRRPTYANYAGFMD